jgi:hypothetical protein
VATDRDSQLSWGGGDHLSINRPAVKFAVEEDVEAGADEDEVWGVYICGRFNVVSLNFLCLQKYFDRMCILFNYFLSYLVIKYSRAVKLCC